jgi:hypothetical protein
MLAFLHECRPTGKKGMFHVPLIICSSMCTGRNRRGKVTNLLGQKQLAIQGPSQRGKLQWTPSVANHE